MASVAQSQRKFLLGNLKEIKVKATFSLKNQSSQFHLFMICMARDRTSRAETAGLRACNAKVNRLSVSEKVCGSLL